MALTMYCPFLTVDYNNKKGRLRIKCERAVVDFANAAEFKEYVSQYCASSTNGWKDCTVAERLLKHYEREEERK